MDAGSGPVSGALASAGERLIDVQVLLIDPAIDELQRLAVENTARIVPSRPSRDNTSSV